MYHLPDFYDAEKNSQVWASSNIHKFFTSHLKQYLVADYLMKICESIQSYLIEGKDQQSSVFLIFLSYDLPRSLLIIIDAGIIATLCRSTQG